MKHARFLQDAGVMFVATVLTGSCNLLYQLVMVRMLKPDDFGTLNALLAWTIVIGMPAGTLQTVTTKFISTYKAAAQERKISNFLWLFSKKLIFIGAIIWGAVTFFSRHLAVLANIEDPKLLSVLGLIVVVSAFLPFISGALQGLQRFIPLAGASIVNAFIRLAGGIMLVGIGWRVAGALWAIVLGSVAAIIIGIMTLWRHFFTAHDPEALSLRGADIISIYKFFLPALLGLASFGLLTNMDVIMVKRFFSGTETGYYSMAQMVGKIILFLPGAITIVMFPKLAERHARNGNTRGILTFSLWTVGILCAAAGAVCMAFPASVLKLLAGNVYPESVPLVLPFSVSMGFYALNQVFLFYHLSVHNTRGIMIFLLVMFAQAGLIMLFHDHLLQVLHILTLCAVSLFALNLLQVRNKVPA